jgi:signal transduction histidine kinase
LATIVNDAPNAMLSVDENEGIINANPKMASLVPAGLIRVSAHVAPFLAYLGSSSADGLQSLVGKDHYVSALDNQASLRYHIFNVIRVSQSEGKYLWILSLVDITEIRYFQNQRDRTLQLLSHDMRTPIASILSLCRQDPATFDDPESSAFKKRRHAEQLLTMMDDFILSIKAQAPKYKLSEVLIDDLMDEAIFQIKDLAAHQRIQIEQEFDHAPQFILVDQRLFTRMLVNLLVNAVRYGAQDSTLKIKLTHDDVDNSIPGVCWVHCHILNRVADLGQEVDNVIQQGFGLGMDFVRTVVGKHHGRIQFDVDKPPGQWAVVHLMLPMNASRVGL